MAIYYGENKLKNIALGNTFMNIVRLGDNLLLNYEQTSNADEIIDGLINLGNGSFTTDVDDIEYFDGYASLSNVSNSAQTLSFRTKNAINNFTIGIARGYYSMNIRLKDSVNGNTQVRFYVFCNEGNLTIDTYLGESQLLKSISLTLDRQEHGRIGFSQNPTMRVYNYSTSITKETSTSPIGNVAYTGIKFPNPVYLEVESSSRVSAVANKWVIYIGPYSQCKDLQQINE